jgi:hypothetical protein
MTTLSRLASFGLACIIVHNARAGSAVAMEPRHCKMVTSYGHPEAIAVQRAMEKARLLYGTNVRLLAATNVTGYCAIGVARVGDRAIVGVALGQKSAIEAQTIVLGQLAKAGGTDPKIISRWKG